MPEKMLRNSRAIILEHVAGKKQSPGHSRASKATERQHGLESPICQPKLSLPPTAKQL